MSFAELGIDIEFSGKDENEKGVIIGLDVEVVSRLRLDPDKLFLGSIIDQRDPNYFRPTEVVLLLGIQPNQKHS